MSHRAVLIVALVAVVAVAAPGRARADDTLAGGTVTDDGGSVIVIAPGSPGVPASGQLPKRGSGSVQPIVCRDYVEEDSSAWLRQADPSSLKPGDWLLVACFESSGAQVGTTRRVQWNPAAPAAAGPTPASLAQIAFNRLSVPVPDVVTWPASGATSLVSLPVWLHVGNWGELHAEASAGGLTATVTARPVRVDWDMGESTVTCTGAGATYNPSVAADRQATDCSYTYRHSSGSQPDDRFHARGTLVWNLSWSATDGQGAELGELSRTTAFTLRVEESQALVVAGR